MCATAESIQSLSVFRFCVCKEIQINPDHWAWCYSSVKCHFRLILFFLLFYQELFESVLWLTQNTVFQSISTGSELIVPYVGHPQSVKNIYNESEPQNLTCWLILYHVRVSLCSKWVVRYYNVRPECNDLADYLNEIGNLPCSARASILMVVLCMPKVCLQNLMWAFSCSYLFPVLFFYSVSVGSLVSCSVHGYHNSKPYVKIGSIN